MKINSTKIPFYILTGRLNIVQLGSRSTNGAKIMFIVMYNADVVFTHSNVSVALSYAAKDSKLVVREFVAGAKSLVDCPIVRGV